MRTQPRTDLSSRVRPAWLWALLLVITGVTFATRYNWPLTEDAVMYALDIMRLDRVGPSAWPVVFNSELSFGYYWLLLQLYRFWHSPEQLVLILALVNVFSSAIVIGLLMHLAQRWFGYPVAFFAGLLLVLAPGFWQLSRYGHPTMPALAAFLGALAALDRVVSDRQMHWMPAVLFVLMVIGAYLLRLDVLLLAPAYLALVAWRGHDVRRQIAQVLALWGAAVVGYLAIRLLVLGYILTPGGGSFLLHVGRTLQHANLASSTAKNLALWAMGLNPLVGMAASLALIGGLYRRQYRQVFFLAAWLLPVTALLPFYALDFSRIATLSAPAAALAAALLPVQFVWRRPPLGLAMLVVSSQLATALIYPAAVYIYAPKTVYHGRPLAAVPLGFVWQDTAFRQRYLDERAHIALQVAAVRDRNVLIVGASNLMLYRFALTTARNAWEEERINIAGVPTGVINTDQNRFYLFDADDCIGCVQPLPALIKALDDGSVMVHPVPFDTRFVSRGIWLDAAALGDQ